jgi:ribonuclease HI
MNNQRSEEFILRFDGCSKGNPGLAGAGAVIYNNDVEVWSHYEFVGEKATNNIAEYHGLLIGLKEAVNKNIQNLKIEGDSLLVIKQMKGEYKVNSENLIELYKEAKNLDKQIKFVSYEHILRNKNKRADKLANQGLPKK